MDAIAAYRGQCATCFGTFIPVARQSGGAFVYDTDAEDDVETKGYESYDDDCIIPSTPQRVDTPSNHIPPTPPPVSRMSALITTLESDIEEPCYQPDIAMTPEVRPTQYAEDWSMGSGYMDGAETHVWPWSISPGNSVFPLMMFTPVDRRPLYQAPRYIRNGVQIFVRQPNFDDESE